MPWYKAGTVSCTQNSNAVIGAGTAFIENSRVGDAFRGPDGGWYEVTNIASDTAMSISPNYQGITNAAGAYALAPMQGYVKDSADALRAFVNQFGAMLGALGNDPTTAGIRNALGLDDTDGLPEGSDNKYWTAARTRSAVLTGMVLSDGSEVVTTDSVLSGIGKLQAQVSDAKTNLASNIRAAKLAGLDVSTATAVVAADSVLVGLGKLQGQLNGIATAVRSTLLTGLDVSSATAILATDSVLAAFGKVQAQLSNSINKNEIINGDFDLWQQAASQTVSGYGSDDQWINGHSGSTKTHSRQSFVYGQTEVPDNPTFFSRTVVSSVAGAGNYCYKITPIEDVTKFSGKTVTLTIRLKADAAKPVAIEFSQSFGTGGSSPVTGIAVQKPTLTTGWLTYTYSFTMPSVAGKTIGVGNYTAVIIWFDAGVNFSSRTSSLGQQSGTFDVAHVKLELGSVATAWEKRSYGQELALAERYYKLQTGSGCWVAQVGGENFFFAIYYGTMRIVPAASLVTAGSFQNINILTANAMTLAGARIQAVSAGAGAAIFVSYIWAFDARL